MFIIGFYFLAKKRVLQLCPIFNVKADSLFLSMQASVLMRACVGVSADVWVDDFLIPQIAHHAHQSDAYVPVFLRVFAQVEWVLFSEHPLVGGLVQKRVLWVFFSSCAQM